MKNNAINFEKLGKSRTFFIYDEDNNLDFNILGYFTIALKVLNIPDKFSNRFIKSLDGYSAKFAGEVITELPVILIGQFAKNSNYKDDILGNELMYFCLNTIFDGQSKLGGRILLLECKPISGLIEFYEKFGFKKIDNEISNEGLIQFIKILNESELMD